jgi:23S rRNA pseudouridine955/2504/2580 synthase
MVFSLTERVKSELLSAFKMRTVEKIYYARCFNHFAKPSAFLTAYLKKDASKSLVKIFDTPVSGAEEILTEYNVLSELDGESIVEVRLHTGKTHQIRAHLAHIGNPVVGDMKYGDTAKNKTKNATRQCLVAKKLNVCTQGVLAYLREKTFVSRFEV